MGVEFRHLSRVDQKRELPPSAQIARDAAAMNQGRAISTSPVLEESLAEFRELARSAGAEIAGEFVQRRDRPDPATLIGKGKLQEISGAVASAGADLVLVDEINRMPPRTQAALLEAMEERQVTIDGKRYELHPHLPMLKPASCQYCEC